jgi:hypothetical protein
MREPISITESQLLEAIRVASDACPADRKGLRTEDIMEMLGLKTPKIAHRLIRNALAAGTIRRIEQAYERIDGRMTTVTAYVPVKLA